MPSSVTSSPTVSIILPTYNRAAYISDAIESVRQQSYTHWELLVIDDGSTDNTAALVTQIEDERIKLYKTSRRLWITGTRNEGLRHVRGELVAFIDSDDLWNPGKLEKQVAALSSYPGAGFCLTGGYNFRQLDQPLEFFYKRRSGLLVDDLLIPLFKSEVAATTPSLILRRNCLEAIGGFDEDKSFADVDFILRLAEHSKGILLYEPLFYRRLHAENISNLEWEKGAQEGIQLIQAYQNRLPADLRHEMLFKLYVHTGEKYLLHKQAGKAAAQFFRAWRHKRFSLVPLRKITKAILYSSGK